MAAMTSPPPHLPSAANDAFSEQLDDDIANIRAEIRRMRERRDLLSASLLSSTKVQDYVRSKGVRQVPEEEQQQPDISISHTDDNNITNGQLNDINPLADAQKHHNESNIHRLAFGITSFPFVDPNPDTSDEALLGIRFDIPNHQGEFDRAPYYLFCKRVASPPSVTGDGASPAPHLLMLHHHTIPAYVPLQRYLEKFLPIPPSTTSTVDDGALNVNSNGAADVDDGPKQDLHALTSAVYTDLKSHSIRRSSIRLLASDLGLDPSATIAQSGQNLQSRAPSSAMSLSLKSLDAVGVDCRFVRLVWKDATVGRLGVSNDGYVVKAIVMGETGRLPKIERLLERKHDGGRIRVADLRDRLTEVESHLHTLAGRVPQGDDVSMIDRDHS